MAKSYNHQAIEKKWQKYWRDNKINQQKRSGKKPKCYVLDMFPYPSGEGLHVGHPRGYIGTDIYSRYKKMSGFNILHPMGWDAFGLPAENYAIKNQVHPSQAVKKNVKRYKEQLSVLGFNYDWDREINTTDPEYYRWTQWVFLKLLENGLAYESYEPINWCPSCQTGLANEDLEDGRCERCGSEIERKPMRQWVLKITKYADRLIEDLSTLDWPEAIKESQRNWIGRSEGLLFTAPVKDMDLEIQTFSTHFEAFYADTFVVIAPDHPLLPELVAGLPREKEVLSFANQLTKQRLRKTYKERELEGIFTGRYIVDPVGNGDLPIWVASYALADYGTGIVKASCHDERDFAFAKKYKIKMKPVLFPKDKELASRVEDLEICFTDMQNGILAEPKAFAGRRAGDVRREIADFAVKQGFAKKKITYKLRDWVFSRQRYWGEPIPIIHCEKCGAVPVPEKDLPVKLPNVKSYAPSGTGESPLANIESWVKTKCPTCGGPGRRETNTMPQWAGSSWYYLRYTDPGNSKNIVDPKNQKYWLPVDMYVGGTEHATRHLIYARFWHKFLYDIGVVSDLEPFKQYRFQGLILADDGRKMSKRFGNVINPDDIVKLYGADTLRIYEMFMGPFNQTVAWSTDSMIGSRRFLEKVWRLQDKIKGSKHNSNLEVIRHQTIKKVSEDIENFAFNTAVSSLMILVNQYDKEFQIGQADYDVLLRLLAPFAPHISEELWHSTKGGKVKTVHQAKWPEYEAVKTVSSQVTLVIQVNGKVRDEITVEKGMDEPSIREEVLARPLVKKWLKGIEPKRIIYVPDKLVNIVI